MHANDFHAWQHNALFELEHKHLTYFLFSHACGADYAVMVIIIICHQANVITCFSSTDFHVGGLMGHYFSLLIEDVKLAK